MTEMLTDLKNFLSWIFYRIMYRRELCVYREFSDSDPLSILSLISILFICAYNKLVLSSKYTYISNSVVICLRSISLGSVALQINQASFNCPFVFPGPQYIFRWEKHEQRRQPDRR